MANVRLLPPLLASVALAACAANEQTGRTGPALSVSAPGNAPIMFSAATVTEMELKTAEMAEGGKFFATMREDKGDDLLRLWRIEGDDARLTAETRVDNTSGYGWKMSVKPDGSQVAVAHAVQKTQLFEKAKSVGEVLVWVVGSDEKKILMSSEQRRSTCGITYYRQGESLAHCWKWGTAEKDWIVYNQDVLADGGAAGPSTLQKLPFFPRVFAPMGDEGYQVEGERHEWESAVSSRIHPIIAAYKKGGRKIGLDTTMGHWQAGYLADGARLLVRDQKKLSVMVAGRQNPVMVVPARKLTQIRADDRLLKPGRDGLMFGVSLNDGLSGYVVGDKAVGEAARNTDARAWYAFAVLDGGDEAAALTDKGIRRLKVSPARLSAALSYAEGLEMIRSGFSGLGADKIIQALETDPSYAGLNVAYPMIHNWPGLLGKAAPADAGRMFLAVHRTAEANKHGEERQAAAVSSIIGLTYHGLYALRAGQPGIARQSLAVLRRLVDESFREGSINSAKKGGVWPDLLEATILADAGNIDEAYAFLAKQGGLVRDGYQDAAGDVLEFTDVFAPLLRDRAKIAYLTGRSENEIRVSAMSGSAKPEPTAYPDVGGIVIAPAFMPSNAEPASDRLPATAPIAAPSGPAAGQVLD